MPLTLSKLAQELGFEQDLTLQGIEYFILHTDRTQEEIKLLLRYYDDNAQIMFDREEKEAPEKRMIRDKKALGLMFKMADIRHQKGILTYYLFNFEDIREIIEYRFIQEIDDDTYDAIEKVINALEEELIKKAAQEKDALC